MICTTTPLTIRHRLDRRRNEALTRGNALLAEGKATQARECFVKAVDVTPEMAFQLIKVRTILLPSLSM
jgi:predicted negative regulator of RcsB-dependent stress response